MAGWLAAIGPVIGALSGVITGAIQRGEAQKAAQALPDPMSFSATPQMLKAEQMFGERAKRGLDPSELRLARQGITRSRAAGARSLENMGLSRISQGMSNIYGMDAEMNLAALNAKAKQDAMNRYLGIAQGFQNIKDQEVSSFNQMLNQQRMALGQAAASGGKNILSGIATGVQGLATNQLADAYASSGDTYNYNLGDATTPATTPMSTPEIDLSVTNTATAPGVGLLGTLEGSGVPWLPAAEQPYIPQTVNTQPTNTLNYQDYMQFMQNPSQYIPGGLTNFKY